MSNFDTFSLTSWIKEIQWMTTKAKMQIIRSWEHINALLIIIVKYE
jgi:hypothetical protein